MWKKYLLSGVVAVFILTNAASVTHAAEMTDEGQPVNEATMVWKQDALMETPETVQAETYETARSILDMLFYEPYEGANYDLLYEVGDEGVVITGIAYHDSSYGLGRLEIPAEINGVKVTGIGDTAFYCCYDLTGSLTIPESVTSIGGSAFSSCSGLTGSLTIPGGVTSIGNYAFFNCSGLSTITVFRKDTEIDYCSFDSNISIKGYSGSTAETYAKEYNCTFIPLDGSSTAAPGATNTPTQTPGATAKPGDPTATPAPTQTPGAEPTYDAKGLVERFYTELLKRGGEEGGINYWTGELETGKVSAMHAGYMYVSLDEFTNQNLPNDEYLERLYKTFMNRPSDEGGKEFWLERLDAGFTRDYVYLSFAVAPEFKEICEKSGIRRGEINDLPDLEKASKAYVNQNLEVLKYVTRCYTKVLNRPADAEGVEYWCGQILTRAIEAKAVAECYVLSEEFVRKNTTDEQYVEVLYQTFFDRAGDEAGTGYWLGQLSSKAMSREDVLHAFSGTPEFTEILAGFGL